MKTLFQAAVIAGLSATTAVAFEAENGVTVNPVSAGAFEVIEGGRLGPRSIWCAAGDYADRQLGVSGSSRIYVATPLGDSQTAAGRRGVVFTLTEPAVQPSGIKVLAFMLRTEGSNLPVHHARRFCDDRRLFRSN